MFIYYEFWQQSVVKMVILMFQNRIGVKVGKTGGRISQRENEAYLIPNQPMGSTNRKTIYQCKPDPVSDYRFSGGLLCFQAGADLSIGKTIHDYTYARRPMDMNT